MSDTPTVQSFPILGLLGIVFITLKLCGVITWSWWVTAPFWGSFIFFVGFIIGFVLVMNWLGK